MTQQDILLNISRRHFFERAFGKAVGVGIGSAALASLLGQSASAQQAPSSLGAHAFDFAPTAKSIIFLQQNGGPPHIDMFDYKPMLEKHDQEPTPDSLIKGERFAFIRGIPKLQKSPFTFRQYGQSGIWLSNILPHTAKIVDDIAFIQSMHTTQFNHGPAQIFQMTGFQIPGRSGIWLLGLLRHRQRSQGSARICGYAFRRRESLWRSSHLVQRFPAHGASRRFATEKRRSH